MASLISKCPLCNKKIIVSTLKCTGCGLELKNDFELSPFDCLTDEQDAFLVAFLKSQGSLKAVQEQMGISYFTAKRKFADLLDSLGLDDTENKTKEGALDMNNWQIDQDSTRASDIVKAKLAACGGKAAVHTLQGKTYNVWVESPNSFACDKITTYTYDIFDVIVEHIISQGGKARKGSGRGHLGDRNCEDDTIAAAILKNYWHSDTGLDPCFVMVAILEWAGIVHNRRGSAELTAEYRVLRNV